MIKNVKIRNYQSLKDADIDLGNFTVIVGESNVGKSSFIRSISALVNNESGKSFITKGKSSTTIEVEFDDGLLATWAKGASAEYLLGKGDGMRRFAKMGTNVPDEVSEALKLGTIDLGGGIKFSPNFHSQFSTPFLTDESGPRIAKILGELSGVNLLYKAISEANLKVKRNSTQLTAYRQDLTEKRRQAQHFKGLKERGQALTTIRELLEKGKSVVDNVETLSDIIDRADSYSGKVKACETLVEQLEGVNDINLDAVADLITRVKDISISIEGLVRIEEKVHIEQDIAGGVRVELDAAEREFNVFKEALDVCPLCERPMDEDDC